MIGFAHGAWTPFLLAPSSRQEKLRDEVRKLRAVSKQVPNVRQPLVVNGDSTGNRTLCVRGSRAWIALNMSAGSAAISGGGEMPAPPQPKKSKRVTLLGILFLFVTFSWALVLFAVMTAMYPLVRLLDDKRRRFHDNVAILWAKLSMASVFCVPRVLGRENLPLPDQSAIYVANHQSFTDIYSMAWLDRRMKFVSKIEILRIPIIGWAMSYCKHVALRRGDRRAQVEAYRAMLNSLRDGNSLAIYPEGTRSVTGRMRKFQSGAFKASISTGVPIVPVTIVGTRELMPPEAYLPVRYPPDGITLIVHPMIYPEGKSEQELNTLAFREINSGLPEVLQAGSSSSSSTSSSS